MLRQMKLPKENTFIFFLLTCAILAGYSLLGGMLFLMTGGDIDDINPWYIAVSQILFLLIPTILMTKMLRMEFSDVFRPNLPSVKFILLSSLGIIFIEIFTEGYMSVQEYIIPESWMSRYKELFADYSQNIVNLIGEGDITILIRASLVIAVVPAISEEFLFRGFLQTNLEKRINIVSAIALSSVLFGAIHFEPVLFVPLTIIGVYLGIVGYLSRSIIVPIILHFLVNMVSIIGVFYGKPENTDELIKTVPIDTGIVFLIIGASGIVGICFLLVRLSKSIKRNPRAEDLSVS